MVDQRGRSRRAGHGRGACHSHFASAPRVNLATVTSPAGRYPRRRLACGIDAVPVPGALIVNIGDLMARWTNDFYRSSPHRVRNRQTDGDRYSMAFFFAPDPQARIECLPTCSSAQNPPRYPPCSAIEHMMEMVERTRRRTVPQIYIGDRHVGGFDDLAALDAAGGLDPLLRDNIRKSAA